LPAARSIGCYIENGSSAKIGLYDVDQKEAKRFATRLRDQQGLDAELHSGLEGVLLGASPIVFGTTALEPYLAVADERLFAHSPTVLHLSLRDIPVNVILASQNIVDDVEHCLKARTSLHLAEMARGSRDFVGSTLLGVLDGKLEPAPGRARIFSPFGLGVLDIAVSDLIFQEAARYGTVGDDA
jgi:ornithine cyclodeaminase